MASYFQTYQETPSSAIEQNLAQDKRPGDTGGPLLPFYLLGGSHFEALVYQLKRLECPNNGYVQTSPKFILLIEMRPGHIAPNPFWMARKI